MNKPTKIFHESWYQIANQQIVLRASVVVKRQMYRGEQWYVLHDPFTNQFYRLRQNAYDFVARLNKNRTIEALWFEMLEHHPDKAPGQGEIIDLLAQLYHANLLHYELATNSVKLFERYKKRRQKMVKMQLFNILFARIPLFDPDNLLQKIMPLIRIIFSPAGIVLWIAVIGMGLKAVFDNVQNLQVQSDGILAPSNLPLLYVAIACIKIIHELGHAFAVRRFGGEVHTMGIMLLMLAPLPYTDASASIAFRNKWQRVLVGASGMLFELFIAAIAALVWAKTGDGVLHSLAYNTLFAASVTTLLFNINPLMRYDGYYILCDLMEIPNLQQLSTQQQKYALERYAFGKRNSTSPATSKREAWFLVLFSFASFIYRIMVFGGILLAISTKMLLLAVIMAVFMIITWMLFPLSKFIKYIFRSPELIRERSRVLRVFFATLAVVFVILAYLPFPYSFKAPGVVKAVGHMITVNKTTGSVISIGKKSGSLVYQNDTLFVLENPELHNQLAITRAALEEAKLQYNKALTASQADLEPVEQRISAYEKRLTHLATEVANLVVRAEIKGVWLAPDADDYIGRWLPRGTSLGKIINHEKFYFASAISQREISGLFSQQPRHTTIRLSGQSNHLLSAVNVTTIPMEQNQLPSSALGFTGGGDIAVVPQDSSGRKTIEPFYEVRADIVAGHDVQLLHGRSGKIRFFLGYKPLLRQGWRKMLQLLQKHYRI